MQGTELDWFPIARDWSRTGSDCKGLEPDWFRLQGTGAGLVPIARDWSRTGSNYKRLEPELEPELVPTTDRKGLVPQPKAKGWFSWFLHRRQIMFFSFWRDKFKMATKTVFFFCVFLGVLSFQLPKFYIL